MATRIHTSLPVTEQPVADGNWDSTRSPITKIIIHTMVGTTESASSRFNTVGGGPGGPASAHYGVSLDGSITHWVDEDNTAYHSGNYAVNQSSIGIEHEDNGDYNGPRTPQLYETSSKLVADICSFYGIPCNRDFIRKHLEVSDHPTACPDSLDIDRIIAGANAILNPPPPVVAPVPETPPVVVEPPVVPTAEIPAELPPIPAEGVSQISKLPTVLDFLRGKKTYIGIALGALYSVLIYFGIAPDNALIWTAIFTFTGVSARLAIK